MRLIVIQFLFFTFYSGRIYGQTFIENSAGLGINYSTGYQGYGSGVSCYDWNRDGLDDLSFASASEPRFYINNGNGFDQINLGITSSQEGKSILWVDYDNDGDSDLFMTRLFGQLSLHRNDGNNQFTDVSAAAGLLNLNVFQSHGASWGDVDNDGWLDLYVCNYNQANSVTNYFYLNNGNGTFTECASNRGINNGYKLSFQSVFFDANMDGWQDLYVVNDKVYNNALYLNDGTGFFTDISQSSQTDIIVDAMSNSIADYDNDGDLDIYISNNSDGNKLLVNNGNLTFTELSTYSQLEVNEFCWGAVWLDVDLDTQLDLFVATSPVSQQPTSNRLFRTDGNVGTYLTDLNSGFENVSDLTHCPASGDFNSDGLPDIVLPKRGQDNVDIWLNNSAEGNYLKVSLEGVISNRDGIGSLITCYTNGTQQIRYKFCGEQYMSQNSKYELFGLGQSSIIDSLTIDWLSGTHDVLYDLTPNQSVNVVEGSTGLTVNFSTNSNPLIPFQLRCVPGNLILHSQEPVSLILYDLQGRCVLTESVIGNRLFKILTAGVYVATITMADGQRYMKKIVMTAN